jgi:hypothetical protein
MKKLLLILIAVIVSSQSFAQNKKVLFEEFTNASCGPCAANNPALKTYMESKGDTIIGVKYHTNFPGFDPMHNANPTQVEQRRGGYYSDVNAVPWLKGDGNCFADIWPFSQANFDAAFNTRKAIAPQVLIYVTDQRIAGDSIKSTVTVNIPATLPAGTYKLRVMATQKYIQYLAPPGSNGELNFPHVFLLGLPDMEGTTLPTTAGAHQFVFKYKRQSTWIDSLISTVAFVQNDASPQKEVLNVGEGADSPVGIGNISSEVPANFILHQNYPNPFNPGTSIKFEIPVSGHVKLKVYNTLGKEVASLINENLIAGVYNFDFTATNLASGLYIYKLETNNFSDIKKMMLVK